MRVYKYKVLDIHPLYITLPKGATLLKFDYQGSPYGNGFNLWALVDPLALKEDRKFILVSTGHDLFQTAEQLKYVGTAEHDSTKLVAHLFEVTP